VILEVNSFMKPSVKIIDPSADRRWDNFIANDHRGSIYQHSLWKDIVQSTYGYQPFYFVLEDSSGDLCGGMPFFLVKSWLTGIRLVSLSFSDYCDILIRDEEEITTIIKAVIEQSKLLRASMIEVRLKNGKENFKDFNFSKSACYKDHILPLDEPLDVIRKKMSKGCRADIKSAQKSGITLEFGTTESDMKGFYNLYVVTRKRHGLIPEPYRFFKNVWQYLYPRNMLSLILAKEGSKTIAGVILLKYKNYAYFLMSSSDQNYLTKHPNHLLWWKGIELVHEEGFRYCDFGRTSLNNIGLLDFKRHFGAVEYDINHYIYGASTKNILLQTIKNNGSTFIHSVCKMMSNPILKLAGNLLYKHLN